MNQQEFKAWFEGYSENIPNLPTKKQWDRIKARIKEIDGSATHVTHFYDHYWRPYYYPAPIPYYNPFPFVTTCMAAGTSGVSLAQNLVGASTVGDNTVGDHTVGIVAMSAFTDLGKCDAVADAQ